MDTEIRKYLIDQCRIGKPIFYENIAKKLNLSLALDRDRSILSKTLGDISAYEHGKGRPLISSIAIYKTANDHGNGFYKLCEELGIGKARDLRDEFYGFIEMSRAKDFWINSLNYSQFYEIKTTVYSDDENPFFNQLDIDFFLKWANKIYDKNNIDHFNAKEYLLSTIWEKTKFWAEEITVRLDEFDCSTRRMWSKRGWKDGERVSIFKPYTWARLYKKGNQEKEIFFTVGYDTSDAAFIYKLDYYREDNSRLSNEQKKLCKKYIPDSIRRCYIYDNEIDNLDWEKTISTVVDFISKNVHHYDELIKLVWGHKQTEELFLDHLTKRDFPIGGFSSPPLFAPSFKGKDIDFIKKNMEDKALGDAGEKLVKNYEIGILKQKGLCELAKNVSIREAGEGYDILSFEDNGKQKFIEVKTTRGNEKTPFMFTENEKLFAEINKSNYYIYRLYNYDEEKNTADFYEIRDVNEELWFSPIEYKVHPRKK